MKKIFFYPLVALLAGCGNTREDNTQVTDMDALIEAADSATATASESALPLHLLNLPEGFEIEVFAEGIEDARSLARGANGTIFVGNRGSDKVWAVRDEDGDGRADKKWVIASGLNSPNGVAFRDGDLYVAEINRILKFPAIESQLDNPPQPVVVNDSYPTDGWHGWKYIAFGPDGWLYVPVGAPCNVCDSEDPIFSTITRIKPDGSQREIYAEGVRNTVGFDWHPQTKELWFTDNGRDMLGNDMPSDELNRAPKKGMHFGFPFCHAGDIQDPEFNSEPCSKFTPPVQKLGPHVAALGMKFYTGNQFPEQYKNKAFVAQHGSWNRDDKIGYRVMQVKLDENGQAAGYEPFITGWLNEQEQEAWGRPVDLLVQPDGSMLISDDHAGAIYRVTYTGKS